MSWYYSFPLCFVGGLLLGYLYGKIRLYFKKREIRIIKQYTARLEARTREIAAEEAALRFQQAWREDRP